MWKKLVVVLSVLVILALVALSFKHLFVLF